MRVTDWISGKVAEFRQERCLHQWAPRVAQSGWECALCGKLDEPPVRALPPVQEPEKAQAKGPERFQAPVRESLLNSTTPSAAGAAWPSVEITPSVGKAKKPSRARVLRSVAVQPPVAAPPGV